VKNWYIFLCLGDFNSHWIIYLQMWELFFSFTFKRIRASHKICLRVGNRLGGLLKSFAVSFLWLYCWNQPMQSWLIWLLVSLSVQQTNLTRLNHLAVHAVIAACWTSHSWVLLGRYCGSTLWSLSTFLLGLSKIMCLSLET